MNTPSTVLVTFEFISTLPTHSKAAKQFQRNVQRAEWLVIIIDRKDVVDNMHQAYEKIENPGYGCFISGPSKTADIAQALVMGAQAARKVTVLIV